MKKNIRVLLLILILLNLLSSIAYAGPLELPRPDSIELTAVTVEGI